MTDLLALLGIPSPRPGRPARARVRCANPECGRPVFVDQLVYGLGRCCAEKAGLVVHRYRLPAHTQVGETLLDHLPKEHHVDPYPQARIDVTGMTPNEAHAKILELARALVEPLPVVAAFPSEVTEALGATAAGLVAILERHAPSDTALRVTCCDHAPHFDRLEAWPCDDYRDAAAGFAVNLPGGDR